MNSAWPGGGTVTIPTKAAPRPRNIGVPAKKSTTAHPRNSKSMTAPVG